MLSASLCSPSCVQSQECDKADDANNRKCRAPHLWAAAYAVRDVRHHMLAIVEEQVVGIVSLQQFVQPSARRMFIYDARFTPGMSPVHS